MRRRLTLVALVASLLAAPRAVGAQAGATTSDLIGLVLDQTGAVLPGAAVTATNTETNLQRSAATGTDGRYGIPALPPGTYTVDVTLPRFNRERREQVVLTIGSTVNLDVTMSVAGPAEQVTVAAVSPLIDPQRTAVASTISQQQIDTLPINGRNFLSFSVLTPGVAIDRTPQQGASATSGLTFAGQRGRANNIMVDGVDNTDETLGSVRATFSQEAVREFQVRSHSYKFKPLPMTAWPARP